MHWLKNPHPVALVVIGLAAAFFKLIPPVSLPHDAAFFLVLPPILFSGGMHLHARHLKKDFTLIAVLAVPGVILSALLIGWILSWIWQVPFIFALLFGALISATDPVSVLAILKKVNAPKRLRNILEAESLFNDGTGVVLFMVILGMAQNHEPLDMARALQQFLLVTIGGGAIGAVCGWGALKAMKVVKSDSGRLLLTVVLCFATPLAAETIHCSGIIAVVTAGLVLGPRCASCLPFWASMDIIMNAVVFVVIGAQLQLIGQDQLIRFSGFILTGILAVLASRILVVYPAVMSCNRIFRPPVPFNWNHVLWWGGLRGTIPIILALQLPDFEWRPLFLTTTFGIVMFNLIVQGLTIKPLLKKLKISHSLAGK